MKITKEMKGIGSISTVIKEVIEQHKLNQGNVGIMVGKQGTCERQEFCESLIYIQEEIPTHNFAVLHTPYMMLLDPVEPEHAALVRRIKRDSLDGIRYNRIFLSVYGDVDVPDNVRKAHDVFIEIIEHSYSDYYVEITINIKESK